MFWTAPTAVLQHVACVASKQGFARTVKAERHPVRAAVGQQYTRTREQLQSVAGKLEVAAGERAEQAEVLAEVRQVVHDSGAHLEDIGLRAADIAAVLQRAEVTREAMSRGMMAIQFFLASVAQGNVADRDAAMQLLEASFREQCAALPSAQGAPTAVRRVLCRHECTASSPRQPTTPVCTP